MKVIQVNDNTIDEMIRGVIAGDRQKQQKTPWKHSYKLEGLTLPEYVQSPRINKRFKISVSYKDEKNTMKHKTIFFGNGDEYAFNKDINARLRKLQSAKYKKNRSDLLSPQYWETTLLQVSDNFTRNMQQMIKNYMQYIWKKAQAKENRPKNKQMI